MYLSNLKSNIKSVYPAHVEGASLRRSVAKRSSPNYGLPTMDYGLLVLTISHILTFIRLWRAFFIFYTKRKYINPPSIPQSNFLA